LDRLHRRAILPRDAIQVLAVLHGVHNRHPGGWPACGDCRACRRDLRHSLRGRHNRSGATSARRRTLIGATAQHQKRDQESDRTQFLQSIHALLLVFPVYRVDFEAPQL
jgi:hypothetical protein